MANDAEVGSQETDTTQHGGKQKPEKTSGKRHWGRWGCLAVVVLLAVLVLAGLILVNHYSSGPPLVRRLQEHAQEAIAGDILIKDAHFDLARGLVIDDITVTDDPEAPPVLEVRRVVCELDNLSLLRLRVRPQRILITDPKVRMKVDEKGKVNLVQMLKAREREEDEAAHGYLRDGVTVSNADVRLSAPYLYGDKEWRRLDSVDLHASPSGPGLNRWSLDLHVRRGKLRGTRASGFVDAGVSPADYYVAMDFPSVRVDREIVHKIPEVGAMIWDWTQPDGWLGAQVFLQPSETQPDEVDYRALLHYRNMQARLKKPSLPFKHVSGSMIVDNGRIGFDQVSAALALSEATCRRTEAGVSGRGRVDTRQGSGVVHVEANSVYLCRELVEKIPDVGPKIWKTVQPKGFVSARGRVTFHQDKAKGLQIDSVGYLRGNELQVVFKGIEISALQGTFFCDDRVVRGQDINGSVAYGTLRDGVFRLLHGPERESRYSGSLKAEGLHLDALMKQVAPDADPLRGRLSASLQFGGTPGDPDSFVLVGDASLKEAELFRAPLVADVYALLQLRLPDLKEKITSGTMQFVYTGDTVQVEHMELSSADLVITGRGTVTVSEDGNRLDLILITAMRPRDVSIPILSSAVRTVLGGIERQLTKVQVTGTLRDPKFKPLTLKPIRHPIKSLKNLFE